MVSIRGFDQFGNLQLIAAFNNSLTFNMDELPSEFLPNRKLDVLNLGGNNITGNYPEAFSTLPSLREVVLELNPHLGGRIPESYVL